MYSAWCRISTGAGGTSRPRYFQIRGIGEREQYEGAPNPSVGFLIDDIDFSGLGMPATLYDLKQIEVLRGPQGTQYGANALAGLIVVRSNDPDRTAGYSLEASGGNYGTGSLGFTAPGRCRCSIPPGACRCRSTRAMASCTTPTCSGAIPTIAMNSPRA
ncbi:MAG: TonB-dependent receptor plug domain-containing protein [Pseudomonadota bacterium]